MGKFSVMTVVLLVGGTLYAQPFHRETEGIPVRINGTMVDLPFAGGMNSPNHQFVDIDSDGDLDLFVLDTDPPVDFYRNEGTRFSPRFALRNGVIPLPPISRWFLYPDIDGDGLRDLLTEDSTLVGVRVYKNTGSPQSPLFTLLVDGLRDSSNNEVFAGQNSIPAVIDIDADGDLDFFSSNYNGTVNYYENVGTSVDLLLAFRTSFWQTITVYGDTCTTNNRPPSLHGASSYTFADIDANGAPDMFIGDIFASGIFHLRNIGTPSMPHLVCVTGSFPTNQPVRSAGFNHSSFIDIDGDGDVDLFVGVLATLVQSDGFLFYRNVGSPSLPVFVLRTRNFLSMIDVGMNAHPAFVDIDADGAQDLFIGNLNGQLAYLHNEGTPLAPSFRLVDSIYQNIAGGFSFAPSFVDIDGDGRKDLFIGTYNGRVKFYHNLGTPYAALFVLEASPVDSINVVFNAAPTFVDIDADGDQDLFVGKNDGRISFYRNDGSVNVFIPVLQTYFYESILVGANAMPTFADIDNDGDQDLFVGSSEGRVAYYENVGTPGAPQFVRRTNHFAETQALREGAPAVVDIDGDGDNDLFIGTQRGGLHFYRNHAVPNAIVETDLPSTPMLFQNYPNPLGANGRSEQSATTIAFQIPRSGFVTLKVYDLLGREVRTIVHGVVQAGTYAHTLDATRLPSGVYFYRLQSNSFSATKKLIVIR